ncbi:MAG: serine/threonine protein kinase, partial [bacterium]|nr:serine/threonine protein kinase [bacterium]
MSKTSAWGERETRLFHELTPDKILTAVESLGFVCTGRILQLNSMENRVYEIEIDGSPGSLIAKFYRPQRWSREQIAEEHRFLLDLGDAEIPVVAPLLFREEQSIFSMDEEGIMFSVFPKCRGRSPDELMDDQIPQIGRLVARMHGVGATRRSDHRLHISPETYGFDNLDILLQEDVLSDRVRDAYCDLVEEICTLSEPMFADIGVQRIHGDCHFGNIILGQSGFSLVDFDDMVVGPCVQDLWLLFPGRDEESKERFSLCLEAYEQMKEFDRRSLRLIEPLRGLRIIHFSAWIAKRYQDPSFQRAFPDYGTERYWSEELRA